MITTWRCTTSLTCRRAGWAWRRRRRPKSTRRARRRHPALGASDFHILHTPGHTQGSVSLDSLRKQAGCRGHALPRQHRAHRPAGRQQQQILASIQTQADDAARMRSVYPRARTGDDDRAGEGAESVPARVNAERQYWRDQSTLIAALLFRLAYPRSPATLRPSHG